MKFSFKFFENFKKRPGQLGLNWSVNVAYRMDELQWDLSAPVILPMQRLSSPNLMLSNSICFTILVGRGTELLEYCIDYVLMPGHVSWLHSHTGRGLWITKPSELQAHVSQCYHV